MRLPPQCLPAFRADCPRMIELGNLRPDRMPNRAENVKFITCIEVRLVDPVLRRDERNRAISSAPRIAQFWNLRILLAGARFGELPDYAYIWYLILRRRQAHRCTGLSQSGCGNGYVEVASNGTLDERVQFRIAKAGPPSCQSFLVDVAALFTLLNKCRRSRDGGWLVFWANHTA